ncbi:unnamed protein product [Dovyalis caffra]|uniref:Uncharacterized protein n=1 Tax=Dovyalis caffra TaxID=77055 RepID=A0AAV1RZK1_9ROSI|nr:unnamed protein product [Dovyalis caffra]
MEEDAAIQKDSAELEGLGLHRSGGLLNAAKDYQDPDSILCLTNHGGTIGNPGDLVIEGLGAGGGDGNFAFISNLFNLRQLASGWCTLRFTWETQAHKLGKAAHEGAATLQHNLASAVYEELLFGPLSCEVTEFNNMQMIRGIFAHMYNLF